MSINIFDLPRTELEAFFRYISAIDGAKVTKKGNRAIILEAAKEYVRIGLTQPTWVLVSEKDLRKLNTKSSLGRHNVRESSEERNEAGSDSFSQAGQRRFPIRRQGSTRIPLRRRGSRRIPLRRRGSRRIPVRRRGSRRIPFRRRGSRRTPSAAAASDNEGGDLDEGPPVDDDGNEPAFGGEVVTAAVEGHPADGNGPLPRRSRCRRKGCPSPHEASFAQRESRQKGRRVSAVALFSAPLRKTLIFFCGRCCAISFCDNYNHTCCELTEMTLSLSSTSSKWESGTDSRGGQSAAVSSTSSLYTYTTGERGLMPTLGPLFRVPDAPFLVWFGSASSTPIRPRIMTWGNNRVSEEQYTPALAQDELVS